MNKYLNLRNVRFNKNRYHFEASLAPILPKPYVHFFSRKLMNYRITIGLRRGGTKIFNDLRWQVTLQYKSKTKSYWDLIVAIYIYYQVGVVSAVRVSQLNVYQGSSLADVPLVLHVETSCCEFTGIIGTWG